MELKLSTKGIGLAAILKPYQAEILKYLYENRVTCFSSREVYDEANRRLTPIEKGRPSVSRASVINFLNHMTDEKLLSYTEKTGKGGHRRIYQWGVNDTVEGWLQIRFLNRLQEVFPEQ